MSSLPQIAAGPVAGDGVTGTYSSAYSLKLGAAAFPEAAVPLLGNERLTRQFQPVAVQDFSLDVKAYWRGRWRAYDGFRYAMIVAAREQGRVVTAQRRCGPEQFELLAKLA